MFNITRLFSDSNGDSHFGDLTVPLHDAGMIGRLSDTMPATGVTFREVDADYDWDFHNTPRKQYLILLDGEIEIETSLGEKRRFRPGDILLLEDTGGKGHRTRNLQPVKRKSIFIAVP
ncbi:MAG: hypothetical protein EOP49_34055 [Sphingobacteriales bacterium]|nr:MAG: hypothetical protein EOP49_34055 [Sphingobacteriales bacterium]